MSRLARVSHELPMVAVVMTVAGGVAMVAGHKWRWGLYVVGAGLVVGAVLRLVLPARRVGVLAVRSRFTDVLTLAFFGVAVLALAAVIPSPNPG